MSPIACSILFVVVVISASVVSGEEAAADHYGKMKAGFDEWVTCHPGYKGMTQSQIDAAQRCQAMNIKEFNCYLSCYRYETGMVKDGHWVDKVAEKDMAQMWDATHQAEAKHWYDASVRCVKAFQAKGLKWQHDYTASCSSKYDDEAIKCWNAARACKPDGDYE